MDSLPDRSQRYAVDGHEGIAFRFVRPGMQTVCDEPELVCEEEECPHDHELCWLDSEPYQEENPLSAVVVMIGDDREMVVDVKDMTPLDEDAYCRDCGQISCTADGRPQSQS
jgi:hypothetical protein